MTDFFALLDQPRRPWVDPDSLEKAFLAGASKVHPDRVNDAPDSARKEAHDRSATLNEAHRCLKESRARLRHFLELEQARKITDLQEMPSSLMDLFTEVGSLCRRADSFIQERADASSPILQVALLERSEDFRAQLLALQNRLKERQSELQTLLLRLDDEWTRANAQVAANKSRILSDLEELYRLFSFNDRWLEQVQARLLQLMT